MADATIARLRPPESVLEITRQLEKSGFEAWCVGGAIRDAMLGHEHLDWDFATDATPDQVRGVFGRKRTIPVGVEFGTVGVLDAAGVLHEVTTFRRDVRTDGRHAEVEFGAELDEDLARRDFTINAIAFSPTTRRIHDPFGGRDDLAAGVVRAVGEPHARMREDRLRALRAIRFAARFGFDIDSATWDAIRASAPYLTRLSAERVKQELEKTMDQVRRPSDALRRWRESGALEVLIPELANTRDEVFAAVDCAAIPLLAARPGRRLTRITTLLSDLTAPAAAQVARRLRFSNQEVQWLSGQVAHWRELDEPMNAALRAGVPPPRDVRRWIAIVGRTALPAFFRLAAARWAARRNAGHAAPAAQAVHALYRRSRRAALTEPVDLRDLAIDGDDLRQAGIPPGPGLGKILHALLELVLEEPQHNTREKLVDEARRLHTTLGARG